MTSKQILTELFNEANRLSFEEPKYATHELWEMCKQIQDDLDVLECFKKYFDFKLVFENNQTFLIFKSKERYLPVDSKISVPNKYYEPLKRWLENE